MSQHSSHQSTIPLIAAVLTGAFFAPAAAAQTTKFINLGRGNLPVHVPASYAPSVAAPLIVVLHGYGSSGAQIESYLDFTALSESFGFLLVAPDGTRDLGGNRFWNATNACCNFGGSPVDDSGYLLDVINEIKAQLVVDNQRVYIVGHSNGGFMSYRMACDHSDTIAAIASLAGATFLNPNVCTPSTTAHTLQIHGTNDGVIAYNGGCLGPQACYPSAVMTTEIWANYNTCSLTPDLTSPPINLEATIAGAETTVAKYNRNCAAGGSAELWTIHGGRHTPNISADFSRLVVEWLYAHPKPENCYADCDTSTGAGTLDIFDFLCFQNSFVASDPYACDCDTSTGPANCDIFDFLCFQNAFVAGCP
jgi:polyhydroxybutyrate depolymerase